MPRNRQERRTQNQKPAAVAASPSLGYSYDDVSEDAYFSSEAFAPAAAAAVEPKNPPATAIAFRPKGDRKPPGGVPTVASAVQAVEPTARPQLSSKQLSTTSTASSRSDRAYANDGRHNYPPAAVATSRNPTNDDEDLIAQKMPRARRGDSSRTAGSAQFSSTTLRYNSISSLNTTSTSRTVARRNHQDQDLMREKLPVARPDHFHHAPVPSVIHEEPPKKKAVKAAKVEIVPDPTTDQPLEWQAAQAFAAPSVPVAHMAEPSSAGALMSMEPSSREAGLEISEGHILPAGRDTVSSYHNHNLGMPMMMTDEPTRTAEATILSYCNIPSYERDPQGAVAVPVGLTNKNVESYKGGSSDADGKPAYKSNSIEAQPVQAHLKGMSPGFEREASTKNEKSKEKGLLSQTQPPLPPQPMAPTNSREAQKLQLEQDLHAGKQASSHHLTDAQREARKIRQYGHDNDPRHVGKMRGDWRDDSTASPTENSEAVTVQHRNTGPSRRVPPGKVPLEPPAERSTQKKCCLMALFGG